MQVEIVDGQFVHKYTEKEQRDYVWQKFFRYWSEWTWKDREFALRNYPDCIDWRWISSQYILSESLMREFRDYLDWNIIMSQLSFFTKEFLEELIERFDDFNISVTFLDKEAIIERIKSSLNECSN